MYHLIPRDLAVKSCEPDSAGIRVTWNDGHRSYYPLEWLAKSGRSNKSGERQGLSSLSLWGNGIKDNEPEVQYRDIMNSDQGVGEWLTLLHRYGFCYVDGTPATPEATEELLKRIAFIRHTHYGGFWDFTSDLASKDTAYTSLGLEAHTDNTYFSDPAGLQMFHCLSHTDGEGGASLLVDGFQAAADLQKEDPEAYNILSTVNVYTHASGNEGISIQPYRAAIDMPLEEVQTWYDAAAKWDRLLKRPQYEYWKQLQPGRPLIFDNWRVLHGRSAFTGKRRLCGGYINRDDYISRFKMLKWGRVAGLN
ncbi:hypothetical protein H2201_007147 [Coniosporium apollinis]|uniref:TauD/TfdA-like domain-containing protein n=1 Tax=Coniosporium apollinis TaxID=61459 RepID=A0ABQ9NK42_9PEZI|nr:hypothetical protein H2201_007147 [Coniosporium apollinis]